MHLGGTLLDGSSLAEVLVAYDAPLAEMSRAQLDNTTSYAYGRDVAGVVRFAAYYYNNLTTITASRYLVNGNAFDVRFGMDGLFRQYGSGEYTVLVFLNGTKGNGFVGATYTVFIGSDGKPYAPKNV
jgi:hypothetical protein